VGLHGSTGERHDALITPKRESALVRLHYWVFTVRDSRWVHPVFHAEKASRGRGWLAFVMLETAAIDVSRA